MSNPLNNSTSDSILSIAQSILIRALTQGTYLNQDTGESIPYSPTTVLNLAKYIYTHNITLDNSNENTSNTPKSKPSTPHNLPRELLNLLQD